MDLSEGGFISFIYSDIEKGSPLCPQLRMQELLKIFQPKIQPVGLKIYIIPMLGHHSC